MELQHNLSFPLFIKKSCIFEKHICSEWGISATHEKLLQSPRHVAHPQKGSLTALSSPVLPLVDFQLCDGYSGLVTGVWLRTGKQGGDCYNSFFHLRPNSNLESPWLSSAYPTSTSRGGVHPITSSTERSQTAKRSWVLLQRNAARPCCCRGGCCSPGRHWAELERTSDLPPET